VSRSRVTSLFVWLVDLGGFCCILNEATFLTRCCLLLDHYFYGPLESFIASSNAFTGSLPKELGLLNLTTFQLQQNKLSGGIPEDFWGNRFLTDLRMDENAIMGTISTLIGGLTLLTSLRLGENVFTGILPAQLTKLSSLGTNESIFCIRVQQSRPVQSLKFFVLLVGFTPQLSCP
jgi:hypothetical protein